MLNRLRNLFSKRDANGFYTQHWAIHRFMREHTNLKPAEYQIEPNGTVYAPFGADLIIKDLPDRKPLTHLPVRFNAAVINLYLPELQNFDWADNFGGQLTFWALKKPDLDITCRANQFNFFECGMETLRIESLGIADISLGNCHQLQTLTVKDRLDDQFPKSPGVSHYIMCRNCTLLHHIDTNFHDRLRLLLQNCTAFTELPSSLLDILRAIQLENSTALPAATELNRFLDGTIIMTGSPDTIQTAVLAQLVNAYHTQYIDFLVQYEAVYKHQWPGVVQSPLCDGNEPMAEIEL